MQIKAEVWQAIKAAERADSPGGGASLVELRLHLASPGEGAALAGLARGLGPQASCRVRADRARVRLPAFAAPQVIRWPGVSQVELAGPGGASPGKRRVLWMAPAGAGLAALAVAAWFTLGGPPQVVRIVDPPAPQAPAAPAVSAPPQGGPPQPGHGRLYSGGPGLGFGRTN